MNASALGFLGKLLLASAAISALIKVVGPWLALSDAGVSDGMALAIVLSLPMAVGIFLLMRWQRSE